MTSLQTDFLRPFVEGFAQLFADEIDGIAWHDAGVYDPDVTGIFIAESPAAPNRIVTLTPVPYSTDPTLAVSTIGLQIRSRSAAADIRDVMALDDQISDVLQGRFPLDLPSGVHVYSLEWTSGGPDGKDKSPVRWNWLSNYTCSVRRPGTHRL